MLVVAGLSLSNLHPRIWDVSSPYYIPDLSAVMVTYADFHRTPSKRRAAMELGIHKWLGLPNSIQVFLDNGAFYFLQRAGDMPINEYEAFVEAAKPDWFPVPRDFIPSPAMSLAEQRQFLTQTMEMNRTYSRGAYVPVIHVGILIEEYVAKILASSHIREKGNLALGGLVPNLLRSPRALPYQQILAGLQHVRSALPKTNIHLFGVGGTSTLHIAGLLGIDSLDSTGWRNRAARGLVQLPGIGDRMVAELGSWRGRVPSREEWDALAICACPACKQFGVTGITARGLDGFCNRATHNLWTLLAEAKLIKHHLSDGTYATWYKSHLYNARFGHLVAELLESTA